MKFRLSFGVPDSGRRRPNVYLKTEVTALEALREDAGQFRERARTERRGAWTHDRRTDHPVSLSRGIDRAAIGDRGAVEFHPCAGHAAAAHLGLPQGSFGTVLG